MKKYKLNWFLIFWIVALVSLIFFYHRWHITKKFIGIVETKSHIIGAQEPGTIRNTLITVGDRVKKGQILVTLDISDLETEISQLKEELANIETLEGAQQERFSLEFQTMDLRLENEASDLSERLSLLESQSTELAGLNAEIDRLQKAEEAGLGHTRDLADLIRQRDALASYLRLQRNELQFQAEKLEKTRRTRQALEQADGDSIIKSMLLRPMERAEELRRLIALAEHRKQLRTIVAPCDGYIIELFARPGDVVQEFMPVLTIEESNPRFLTVFIPEQSDSNPQVGAHVKVYSPRLSRYTTSGVVSFVHPGFTQTSERLSFRGQIFWARKIEVDLDENHSLLPSEIVYARIDNHNRNGDSQFLSANASETHSTKIGGLNGTAPVLMDMQVSQTLWKQSRFEPSGIAWIQELERYLIVSDDTGINETVNEHAPWVFLMDREGKVDSTPVTLADINTVNDLETIAPFENGEFFLVSSQNISKRGNRPVNREMILKVVRESKRFRVKQKVAFLSLLLQSYSRDHLKTLGLEEFAKDKLPVLNIEGATYHNGVLYLGLKEPVSKKGAIIWKLSDPNSIFSGQKLTPGQLSVYGYVQLGEHEGKTASISDMTFDHLGRLWILSTIAGAEDDKQMGGFHRIDRFADGRLESTCVLSFPGLKPEGICLQNTEDFLIVFDKDNETPSFCTVSMEDL